MEPYEDWRSIEEKLQKPKPSFRGDIAEAEPSTRHDNDGESDISSYKSPESDKDALAASCRAPPSNIKSPSRDPKRCILHQLNHDVEPSSDRTTRTSQTSLAKNDQKSIMAETVRHLETDKHYDSTNETTLSLKVAPGTSSWFS